MENVASVVKQMLLKVELTNRLRLHKVEPRLWMLIRAVLNVVSHVKYIWRSNLNRDRKKTGQCKKNP